MLIFSGQFTCTHFGTCSFQFDASSTNDIQVSTPSNLIITDLLEAINVKL